MDSFVWLEWITHPKSPAIPGPTQLTPDIPGPNPVTRGSQEHNPDIPERPGVSPDIRAFPVASQVYILLCITFL